MHGLEFDSKTLELIDYDGDGRIRVPEILAAVKWATSILKNPDDLLKGESTLPLSAINDSIPEGKEILASAKQILANLGKPESPVITAEDTADTVKIFAATRFNGDGIITVDAAEDEETSAVIKEIISCLGSDLDRSGEPGVSSEKVELFFKECQDYADWWSRAEGDPNKTLLLAESDGAALASFKMLQPKVEDFFLRCRLAEYDPLAAEVLNPSPDDYRTLAVKDISTSPDVLEMLPLAHVAPGRSLPLSKGINPAWAPLAASFQARVVEPMLGNKSDLTIEEWKGLENALKSYEEWLESKQGAAVESLGIQRVREILAGGSRDVITALLQRDQALEPMANAIASVDKLVRYHRDLNRLLHNFVCFHDFYTPGYKAIFQMGTLYIDGKSCELCVKVTDVDQHSVLAALSRTYLVYCECSRGEDKMIIAAAFTEGDTENLLVGRNGVFYDRKGQDWDATIVKIIEYPTSIRQAFWSPYKRAARMVSAQLEKFAATRDKQIQDSAAVGIASAEQKAGAPKPDQQPFDVGKFAGIFAAIGLALGAIGTAIAAVLTGFLGLAWWQMPLAILGVVLVISGPSMILAYLNLRQRNLAPILDANGWAVNSRAKINIPFGASLTKLAKLPKGAHRSLRDPYAEKKLPWKLYGILVIGVLILLLLLQRGYLVPWLRQLLQG